MESNTNKTDSKQAKTPQERTMIWEDLKVDAWLKKSCSELGMNTPTPIQVNCIPPILKGKAVIGSAPTGSGKTAAFAIPILQSLAQDIYGIFACILTPTRELAFQIGEQFSALGAPIGVRVEVIVGGKEMMHQALALTKKPHIVVATPGRLLDHFNSTHGFTMNKLKFLVLDEADRMITNEQMFGDVKSIIQHLPPPTKRQTLLFSATMNIPQGLLDELELNNVHRWSIGETFNTVETLTQLYIFIPPKVKDVYLTYLLRQEETPDESGNDNATHADEEDDNVGSRNQQKSSTVSSIIVFAKTCYTAQLLFEMLQRLGIRSVVLHSQLSQRDRMKSVELFKAGVVKVLVATDVASRGLDIPSVELVINFDVPREVEDYIHRVGRTARQGRGGRAITLITQFDIDKIHKVENAIGKKLEELAIDEDDALRHLNESITARAMAMLRMEETRFGEKKRKSHQQETTDAQPTKRKQKVK
mmetsp:Transcript_21691/g.30344  ORF Transcript_21691/g.30344 Transcript_21691/m.30344 type:complete len:475 (-) Transcript_21691:8-1432(-)